MGTLVISASAIRRKDALGGGYRGVALDKRSGVVTQSEVVPTIEAARHWVRGEVDRLMVGQPWAPGYIYKPRWTLNVWVH